MRRVAGSAVLAALLLSGCGPTPADRKALEGAYGAYAAKDFARTETLAGTYIQNEPTAPNVDEAFYLRGVARYSKGDRAGATADLQKAIGKTRRNDLKEKAYATLGDLAFEQNDWKTAAADYQKAIGFAAGGRVDARLNYRLGSALQAMGQWENAKGAFKQVIVANTDATLGRRAEQRMELHAFSLQFGAFREGPLAAALIQKLKGAGIQATAGAEMRDGVLMFVVRAGSYATWAEAEAARRAVAGRFPQVAIVP